jgi:alkylhydroperoxidase/carboxymuconolactone decarboxylase family protein YurZ
MSESLSRLPSQYLAQESPDAASRWRELRGAIRDSGSLDESICELLLVTGFAFAGYEDSFKEHARRAVAAGIPPESVRYSIVTTLGVLMSMFQIARALQWLDDIGIGATEHPPV